MSEDVRVVSEDVKLEWACRQIEALWKRVAELEARQAQAWTQPITVRVVESPAYTLGPGGIPLP